VIIYDLTGRVIQILKDQPVGTELTTGRGLISGMYLVEVKSGELSDRIKVVKTN
jgi:hypothetical protein